MSKFFGYSSSETESEEEKEEVIKKPPRAFVFKQFEESEEEELIEKRAIRSDEVKRFEEINNFIKQLNNVKKIKDLSKSTEIFEEMVKYYEKCNKVIEKLGQFKQFIRSIAELEDFVNTSNALAVNHWCLWTDTAWKSTTAKTNIVYLSKLRQRIKKYNRNFQNEILDFNKNPESYPTGEDEESEVEEENQKPNEVLKGEEGEEEETSDESEISDDEKSEWSAEEIDKTSTEEESELEEGERWKKFLKKDKISPTLKKPKEKERQSVLTLPSKQTKLVTEKNLEKQKLFAENEEINHENLLKKVEEIISSRGRKGYKKREQLEILDELKSITIQYNLGVAVEIKIIYYKIIISFDYDPILNSSMKTEVWMNCLNYLNELLDLLVPTSIELSDIEENYSDLNKTLKIQANLVSLVDSLSEEYMKILQNTDPYGTAYLERLKMEPQLIEVIDRVSNYYEKNINDPQNMCSIYLRKIETFYYKYDISRNEEITNLMDKLCKFIYTNDKINLRAKAILYHVYHHAVNDRWSEARDLFLMSHLQENIDNADILMQILYNRTLVQFGLCGFRNGFYKEAHDSLIDLQVSNRARELLAQGYSTQRNVIKTKEEEKKEKKRQIPFHMHINLELVEFVYLVCAILLEIPYMCSSEYDPKKRLISRQFYYQLKLSERQAVVGPPDNMREHVMAAAKAMKKADWKSCVSFLINDKLELKIWRLIQQNVVLVKERLIQKVKEETARTYLFKYSMVYETFDVQFLADMFEIDFEFMNRVVSKMIFNNELMASLDHPTQMIVMHRTEPTKIQRNALQLVDKLNSFTDLAERIVNLKASESGVVFKPIRKRKF